MLCNRKKKKIEVLMMHSVLKVEESLICQENTNPHSRGNNGNTFNHFHPFSYSDVQKPLPHRNRILLIDIQFQEVNLHSVDIDRVFLVVSELVMIALHQIR
jgi:hypothetical protein